MVHTSPATQFDDASGNARTRAFAAELDDLIHLNLDLGTEQGDMEMHEIVAETVMNIPQTVLTYLSDHTLARMMLTLGQHANEQRALGYKIGDREREAGYRLVLAARVPESFARHLSRCEDRLIDAIGSYHFLDRNQSNVDINPNQIQTIANRFMQDFAVAYGMDDAPRVRLFEDRGKNAYSGLYMSECGEGPGQIDINIAHIRRFTDLPKLVLVMGHEALHGYADSIIHESADLSMFDQDWGAHFMMLNVFNKLFYSLDARVYPHHAEEKLAEATGVRLAARTIARMGLPLRVSDFTESQQWMSTEMIENILGAENGAPTVRLRGGGVTLSVTSGPTRPVSPG